MGTSYKLPNDGNSTGNAYGLYWSHQNAGSKGGANNLTDHGILVIDAGGFRAALSNSLVVTSEVRGSLFRDYNSTSYYMDPQGTSRINGYILFLLEIKYPEMMLVFGFKVLIMIGVS